MRGTLLIVAAAAAAALVSAHGVAAGESSAAQSASARELGAVRWGRDYDAAVARSRASGRPVFLLFQEVPGCRTCVGFGESVLSHPLLVDAIEHEFVPLAILNNRGGDDREVLERFGEPAWNDPVVRFVDAEGRDLVPRAEGVWSTGGIATRMRAALEAARRSVPAYLEIAAAETSVQRVGRAVLQTHCFWEGEGCLGALPGVVATEAAWLGGFEVVSVRFDPAVVGYADLLRAAHAAGCASAVFARDAGELETARSIYPDAARLAPQAPRAARAADQKRYLSATPLASLELTPLQQARVNAALANGTDPLRWLSPSQRSALATR